MAKRRHKVSQKKINHRHMNNYTVMIIEAYRKNDFSEALKCCDYYLEKFPNDQRVIRLKADILSKINKVDDALLLLDLCDELKDNKYYLITRLHCLMVKEEYEEALNIYNKLKYEYVFEKDIDLKIDLHYMTILKELDNERLISEFGSKTDLTYFQKQLVDYEEEAFFRTMKSNSKNPKIPWIYNKDFDLNIEIGNIKEKISNYKRCPHYNFDAYYIKSENCGLYNDERCDYLKVETVKNTKDIVTVIPITSEMYSYKPTNYEMEYMIENASKKKDMIKRFNDRFNKKLNS